MAEEVPAPLPEPGPTVTDQEKIPESWIEGYTEFRARMTHFEDSVERFQRNVRVVTLLLGLGFLAFGVVCLVLLVHTNQLHSQADRNTTDIAEQARKDKLVFCNAIEKSVATSIREHKPVDPNTAQFEKDYGCTSISLPGGAGR